MVKALSYRNPELRLKIGTEHATSKQLPLCGGGVCEDC
jgi:hypothetical protein